jgi:hypothetical protein
MYVCMYVCMCVCVCVCVCEYTGVCVIFVYMCVFVCVCLCARVYFMCVYQLQVHMHEVFRGARHGVQSIDNRPFVDANGDDSVTAFRCLCFREGQPEGVVCSTLCIN